MKMGKKKTSKSPKKKMVKVTVSKGKPMVKVKKKSKY